MKRAVDRTFDPESDTQFVAQVSALGAIADAVVRDVVKARSGRKRLSECAAVERAADPISRVA
ncbi:hypothetical protein, partial [Escherichia coli]|uniref:hypothetical protein n=1 Tax=Escherichia coli TaxID=562 RepID=UPI00278BB1C1